MLAVIKPMDLRDAINQRTTNSLQSESDCYRQPSIMSEPMKHPSPRTENHEFNLGNALDLRCVDNSSVTVCGNCESCLLIYKIKEAKEYIGRFGDHSKKRLMLGLLRRVKSIDLLNNLSLLLRPTLNKDFTYARARTNPSLNTDVATVSSDRAINPDAVEQETIAIWEWFFFSTYWTKTNFLFSLLQLCDSHLLHVLYTQTRTLLATEQKAAETHSGKVLYFFLM